MNNNFKAVKKIIFILLIIVISLFFISRGYGYLNTKNEFLNMDENNLLRKQKEDFYNKSPELISYGEYLDIKYLSFSNDNPSNCLISFYFKTKRFETIDKIEVQINKNKEDDKTTTIQRNNYNPFKTNKNKILNLERYNRSVRLSLISLDEKLALHEFNSMCLNDKYDFSNLLFSFSFKDGHNEKINLQANKESMFQYWNVDLNTEEIINNMNFRNENQIDDLNELMTSTQDYYYYRYEDWFKEVDSIIETIIKSNKYKDFLRSNDSNLEVIFYPFTRSKCLTKEEATFIYSSLKKMFYNSDSVISVYNKKMIFDMVNLVNDKMFLFDESILEKYIEEENIKKILEKQL